MQDEIGAILKATDFAAQKHRHQRRKDPEASPYINHPISAALVLWHEAGVRDVDAIVAALLHDTVEDTETTLDELTEEFGETISNIVAEVTDDKGLPKEERKRLQVVHAKDASRSAKLVKIADKICNIRDVAHAPPPSWPLQRRQAYFDWAKAVVDAARGVHPGLEALFDKAYTLRPVE